MNKLELKTLSKQEFIEKHLLSINNICTDILTEISMFTSECYSFGMQHIMTITNNQKEKCVIIPYEYSSELLNQIKEYFPPINEYIFISDKKQKNQYDNLNADIYFHYSYNNLHKITTPEKNSVKIVKITDDKLDILHKYCIENQNQMEEQHPAKITNIYQNFKKATDDIIRDIYIILSAQNNVGLIITNSQKRYNYVTIGQLLIEPQFQRKGYGYKSLELITKEIIYNNMLPYYSTVNINNIASINCCKRAGYVYSSSRIHVHTQSEKSINDG